MSVSRTGAGGIRNLRRTLRIVDAPTRWPTLSNSPWILRYPQLRFSRAMGSISTVTASQRVDARDGVDTSISWLPGDDASAGLNPPGVSGGSIS
jgi:hypothetical protein